jgi:hypothetical protein
MDKRAVPKFVCRDAFAREILKYVRWSSIFALPASTVASVGPVLDTRVDVTPGEESSNVFRLFKGLGGDISRNRLEGTSIVVVWFADAAF